MGAGQRAGAAALRCREALRRCGGDEASRRRRAERERERERAEEGRRRREEEMDPVRPSVVADAVTADAVITDAVITDAVITDTAIMGVSPSPMESSRGREEEDWKSSPMQSSLIQ